MASKKLSPVLQEHVDQYGEPQEIVLGPRGGLGGSQVTFAGMVSFDKEIVKEARDRWPDKVRRSGQPST